MTFGKLTGDQSYLPQSQEAQGGAFFSGYGRGAVDNKAVSFVGDSGYGDDPSLDDKIRITPENAANLDYMRGEEQSWGQKRWRGITKFLAKTGVEFAGGMGSLFYGTAAAISDGSMRSFVENDFTTGLEGLREYVDKELALYRTEEEAKSKFGGWGNFWYDTVLGGASFVVGAALTEAAYSGITAATFGAGAGLQAAHTASLLQRAARITRKASDGAQRLGRAVDRVASVSQVMSKTPNAVNRLARVFKAGDEAERLGAKIWSRIGSARRIGTSAGYESTIEAKDFLNRAEEEWRELRRNDPNNWTIDPNTGEEVFVEATPEERALFHEGIQGSVNGVFLANMAVVSQLRSVAYAKIFGKPSTARALGSVRRAQMLNSSKAGTRALGRAGQVIHGGAAFLKAPVSEGMEELLQGSIRNTALNYTMTKAEVLGTNEDDWSRFFEDGMGDLIQSTGHELKKTFTFKDWDQTLEGIVGAILGATGLPVNLRAWRRQRVKQDDGTYVTKMVRDPKQPFWAGGSIQDFRDFLKGERNAEVMRKFVKDKKLEDVLQFARQNPDIQPSLRAMLPALPRLWRATQQAEAAVAGGQPRLAKNAEADLLHSYMSAHIQAGLYNQMINELEGTLANMSDDDFRATFYADVTTITPEEIQQRKREVLDKFKARAKEMRKIQRNVDDVVPYDFSDPVNNSAHDFMSYLAYVAHDRKERLASINQDLIDAFPQLGLSQHLRQAADTISEIEQIYNQPGDVEDGGRRVGLKGMRKSYETIRNALSIIEAINDQIAQHGNSPGLQTALADVTDEWYKAVLEFENHAADIGMKAAERDAYRNALDDFIDFKDEYKRANETQNAADPAEKLRIDNALDDYLELNAEITAAGQQYNEVSSPQGLAELRRELTKRYNDILNQSPPPTVAPTVAPPTSAPTAAPTTGAGATGSSTGSSPSGSSPGSNTGGHLSEAEHQANMQAARAAGKKGYLIWDKSSNNNWLVYDLDKDTWSEVSQSDLKLATIADYLNAANTLGNTLIGARPAPKDAVYYESYNDGSIQMYDKDGNDVFEDPLPHGETRAGTDISTLKKITQVEFNNGLMSMRDNGVFDPTYVPPAPPAPPGNPADPNNPATPGNTAERGDISINSMYDFELDEADPGYESGKALGELLMAKFKEMRDDPNRRTEDPFNDMQGSIAPVTDPNDPVFTRRPDLVPFTPDMDPNDYDKVPIMMEITHNGKRYRAWYKDMTGVSSKGFAKIGDERIARDLHAGLKPGTQPLWDPVNRTANVKNGDDVWVRDSMTGQGAPKLAGFGTVLGHEVNKGSTVYIIQMKDGSIFKTTARWLYRADDVVSPEAIINDLQESQRLMEVENAKKYMSETEQEFHRKQRVRILEDTKAGKPTEIVSFSLKRGNYKNLRDETTGKPIKRKLSEVKGLGFDKIDPNHIHFDDKFYEDGSDFPNHVVMAVGVGKNTDKTTKRYVSVADGATEVTIANGRIEGEGQLYLFPRNEDSADPNRTRPIRLDKAKLTHEQLLALVDALVPKPGESWSTPLPNGMLRTDLLALIAFEGERTTHYEWMGRQAHGFWFGGARQTRPGMLVPDENNMGLWVNIPSNTVKTGEWVNLLEYGSNRDAFVADMAAKLSNSLVFQVDLQTFGHTVDELRSTGALANAKAGADGSITILPGVVLTAEDQANPDLTWGGFMIRDGMIVTDLADDVYQPPFLNANIKKPNEAPAKPAPPVEPAAPAAPAAPETRGTFGVSRLKDESEGDYVAHLLNRFNAGSSIFTTPHFQSILDAFVKTGLINSKNHYAIVIPPQYVDEVRRALGVDPDVPAITIAIPMETGGDVETTIFFNTPSTVVYAHELMHVALGQLSSKMEPVISEAYIASLDSWLQHVTQRVKENNGNVPPKVDAWLQLLNSPDAHVEEIATYALTEPEIVRWLASQQGFGPKANRSLWDALKDILIKALASVVGEDDSLLTDLTSILNSFTIAESSSGATKTESEVKAESKTETEAKTESESESESETKTESTETESTEAESSTEAETGEETTTETKLYDSPDDYINSIAGPIRKLPPRKRNYKELDIKGDKAAKLSHVGSVTQFGTAVRSLAFMAINGAKKGLYGGQKVSIDHVKQQLASFIQNPNLTPEKKAIYKELYDNWDNGISQAVRYELYKTKLLSASTERISKNKDDEFQQVLVNDENISSEEKMSALLKQFLRTQPQYTFDSNGDLALVLDPVTGLPVPEDFQRRLPELYQDLVGSQSLEEMMYRILDKAGSSPFYYALYSRLTDPTLTVNELHNLLTTMYEHFSMQQVNYSSVFYGVDNNGKTKVEVRDAVMIKAENDYRKQFGLNLAYGYTAFERENGAMTGRVNRPAVAALQARYDKLVTRLKDNLKKDDYTYEMARDEFVSMLNELGINVDGLVIDQLLKYETNPVNKTIPFGVSKQGLYNFITLRPTASNDGSAISPMMLFSRAVNSATNVLLTLDNLNPKTVAELYTKHTKSAVDVYSRYLAATAPIRQHSMIEGPNEEDYYRISEQNTITDDCAAIANPKNEIARTFLQKLLDDTYSKDSWILANPNRRARLKAFLDFATTRSDTNEASKDYAGRLAQEQILSDMAKVLGVDSNTTVIIGPTPADKASKWNISVGEKMNGMPVFTVLGNDWTDAMNLKTLAVQFPAATVEQFAKYFETEMQCILEAAAVARDLKNSKKNGNVRDINNYYFGKNGALGNGLKFRDFTRVEVTQKMWDAIHKELGLAAARVMRTNDRTINLNDIIEEIGPEAGIAFIKKHIYTNETKSAFINKVLERRVNGEVRKLIKHGVIRRSKNSNLEYSVPSEFVLGNSVIPNNIYRHYLNKLLKSDPALSALDNSVRQALTVYSIAADFTINAAMGSIEFSKLFYGDPATYKDAKDKTKRTGGANSTGTKLRTNFTNFDEVYAEAIPADLRAKLDQFYADNDMTDDDYIVVELEDEVVGFNETERFAAEAMMHEGLGVLTRLKNEALEDYMRAMLESYNKMNTADGACYVSPQFYKQYLIRMGQYTPEVARAFEYLLDPTHTDPVLLERAHGVVCMPIKATYNGPVSEHLDNAASARVFDKTAMFPVFHFMAQGTQFEEMYKYMVAPGNSHRGVMFKMASATKVAGLRKPAKYSDPSSYDSARTKQSYGWLRRQQIVEPHKGHSRKIGVQAKRIILGGVNTSRNVNAARHNAITALNRLSDIGINETLNKLGIELSDDGRQMKIEPQRLLNALRAEAIGSNLGMRIIEALREGINDWNSIELSALTESKSLQSKVLSAIFKGVVDVELSGGMYVQESVFGHNSVVNDEQLNYNNADGTMDIKVGISMFSDIIPKHLKTFAERRAWLFQNPDVLKVFGYRTPTQSKASLIYGRIVDVLPETVGDIVVLPKEIVSIAGSDYDIDKVVLHRYALRSSDAGPVKLEYPSRDWYYADAVSSLSKERTQNLLLDQLFTIMSDPTVAAEMRMPLDSDTAKLNKILKEDLGFSESTVEDDALSSTSPSFQAEVKVNYNAGKDGIGPFAIAIKLHNLGTRSKLAIGREFDDLRDWLKLADLDDPIGRDGIPVSSWLSGCASLMVDYAKDPVAGQANFNMSTDGTIAYLLRCGWGKHTFPFIAQPILKQLAEAERKASVTYGLPEHEQALRPYARARKYKNAVYKALVDELKGRAKGKRTLSFTGLNDEKFDITPADFYDSRGIDLLEYFAPMSYYAKLIDDYDGHVAMSRKYEQDGNFKNFTVAELVHQFVIAAIYEYMQPMVATLRQVDTKCNIDNSSKFTDITELVFEHFSTQALLTNGAVTDLGDLFNAGGIDVMYDNTIAKILTIAGQMFKEYTPTMAIPAVNAIRAIGVQNGAKSTKAFNRLTAKLKSYHIAKAVEAELARFFGDELEATGAQSKYVFDKLIDDDAECGIPRLFSIIKERISKPGTSLYDKYNGSVLFDILKANFSDELGTTVIQSQYVKNIQENAKDEAMRDWDIMSRDGTTLTTLTNGQKVTVADFALLLGAYSYYTSGYTTTQTSFHNMMPLGVLQQLGIDKAVAGIDDHAANNVDMFNTVLPSLWYDNDIVPYVNVALRVDNNMSDEERAMMPEEAIVSQFAELDTYTKFGEGMIKFKVVKSLNGAATTYMGNPTSFDPMIELFTGVTVTPDGMGTYLQFKPVVKTKDKKTNEVKLYKYVGYEVVFLGEDNSGTPTYTAEPIYVISEPVGVHNTTEGVHIEQFAEHRVTRPVQLGNIMVPGLSRKDVNKVLAAMKDEPYDTKGNLPIARLAYVKESPGEKINNYVQAVRSYSNGKFTISSFGVDVNKVTVDDTPTARKRTYRELIPAETIVELLLDRSATDMTDEVDGEAMTKQSPNEVMPEDVVRSVDTNLKKYLGDNVLNDESDAAATTTVVDGHTVLHYNPKHPLLVGSVSPSLAAVVAAVLTDHTDVSSAVGQAIGTDDAVSIVKFIGDNIDDPMVKPVIQDIYSKFGISRVSLRKLAKAKLKPNTADTRIRAYKPLNSVAMPATSTEIQAAIDRAGASIVLDPIAHKYYKIDPATGARSPHRMIGVTEGKGLIGYEYEESKTDSAIRAKEVNIARGNLVHGILERFVKGHPLTTADLSATSGATTITTDIAIANKLQSAVHAALLAEGIDVANCDVYSEFTMPDMSARDNTGLVGTVDLFLVDRTTGRKILLDYKTKDMRTGFSAYNTPWYLGESQRSGYDLQSAAYTYLLNKAGIPVDSRGCVLIKVDVVGNQLVDVEIDNTATTNGIDWFGMDSHEHMHMADEELLNTTREATRRGMLPTGRINLKQHVRQAIGLLEGRVRQLRSQLSTGVNVNEIEFQIRRINDLIDGLRNGRPTVVLNSMLQQIALDIAEAHRQLEAAEHGHTTSESLANIRTMLEVNEGLVKELLVVTTNAGSTLTQSMPIEQRVRVSQEATRLGGELANVKARISVISNDFLEYKVRKLAKDAGVSHMIESFDWEATHHDVNWLFRYFGSIRHSSDSLSKAIHYMVVNQLNAASYDTYDRGVKLTKLYHKAKQAGVDLRDFMEVKDGKYTGHFVTEHIHSMAQQDYNDFMNELRAEFGLPLDGHDDWVPNPVRRAEFNARRKVWFDDHAERYFSDAYYALADEVSPAAKHEMNQINSMLNSITGLDKYKTDGYFDASKLSAEDRLFYEDCQIRKREISSLYDRWGRAKHGIDREIALEWQRYNEGIARLMETRLNYTAWSTARANFAATHTVDELAEWDRVNTRREIENADAFFDEIKDAARRRIQAGYRDEYERLDSEMRALKRIWTDPTTGNLLGSVNDEVARQFKAIEERMRELRELHSEFITGPAEFGVEFDSIARVVVDPRYTRLLAEARAAGPAALREFIAANAMDASGRTPIRMWTKLEPVDTVKYPMKDTPSGNWAEDVEHSPLLNPAFDRSVKDHFWQAKRDRYNVANYPELAAKWARINSHPDIRALYDELISTMKDAEAFIPFLNRSGLNMLPQIRKKGWERAKVRNGMFKRIADGVKDFVFKPNIDDDEWTTEPIKRGLEGTKSMALPVWYTSPLENMDELSEDIVSTVIQFYQMASQYKHMSQIKSDIDLIMDKMANREVIKGRETISGASSGVYDQTMKFLEMNMFGKRKDAMLMGKGKVSGSKIMNTIVSWTRINGLAFNPFTMAANFGSAKIYSHIEGLLGRYYDREDYMWAMTEMQRSLPSDLNDVFRADNLHKSKVMAIFDFFRLGGSGNQFKNVGQHHTARFDPVDKLLWGGYTMGDFHTKGTVALAVMRNYRLIGDRFVSKREFLSSKLAGVSHADKAAARKAALLEWKTYDTTLYDAFDLSEGRLSIKPEFEATVPRELMSRVNNEIRSIATDIDGQLSSTDKAAISQSVFGQFLVTFRSWLQNAVQTRFKSKGENWMTGDMDMGQYNATWSFMRKFVAGMRSGVEETQRWNNVYRYLSDNEKRLVRKTAFELFNISILAAICFLLLGAEPPKGNDPVGYKMTKYMMLRLFGEFVAMYNPSEVLAILQSPTAAKPLLDNMLGFWNILNTDEVKAGPYKGWTKSQRTLMKMTPLKNIHEAQFAETKYRYLLEQIIPG